MPLDSQRSLTLQHDTTGTCSDIPFNVKIALRLNANAFGTDRLRKTEVLHAGNIKVKPSDVVGVSKRQSGRTGKPQCLVARADRAAVGDCNRKTLSRNHALSKLPDRLGHLDTVGCKHHLRIAGGGQHPHDSVDFGNVHPLICSQCQPAVGTGRIHCESLFFRAETAITAAKRHGSALNERIRSRSLNAVLTGNPQHFSGNHTAGGKHCIAGHKDIAGSLRVNPRIFSFNLDADGTFQRHSHTAALGVPNNVAHIRTRQHLESFKPFFRCDIQIGKTVCRLVHFITDVSGVVHNDIDASRLDIGFSRLGSRTRIRIDDGIRNGKKKFLLRPTILIFGCDGLCQGTFGIGLFRIDRRFKTCRITKPFLERRVVGLLLGCEFLSLSIRQIPIGIVSVVLCGHDIGLSLHVGLPTSFSVVGSTFSQNTRIDPTLNAFLSITLIKIFTSNGIRQAAVVYDNGNQVSRLHLADAQISVGMNHNVIGGKRIKPLGTILRGKLRKLVECKRSFLALKAHVLRADVLHRHCSANGHVDCAGSNQILDTDASTLRKRRSVKVNIPSCRGGEIHGSRGTRETHRRRFAADRVARGQTHGLRTTDRRRIVGTENIGAGNKRHAAARSRQIARQFDIGVRTNVDRVFARHETYVDELIGLDRISTNFRGSIVLFTMQMVRAREMRPVGIRGP